MRRRQGQTIEESRAVARKPKMMLLINCPTTVPQRSGALQRIARRKMEMAGRSTAELCRMSNDNGIVLANCTSSLS